MLSNNLYPNLVIAGSPKCGTTSLFEWLAAHPEIMGSSVKETYFLMDKTYPLFNKSLNYYSHGLDGYTTYFDSKSDDTQILLEATPDYMYQKTAVKVLSELPQKPHIIFILRKPSDRIYSLYRFAANNLAIIDKNMSFSSYINMIKSKNNSFFTNREILRDAIIHSQYINYLNYWGDSIGKDNISIYLFEDMARNPKAFMVKLCHKHNIDPSFFENFNYEKKNITNIIKNQKLHRIKLSLNDTILRQYLSSLKPLYNFLNIGTYTKYGKTKGDVNMLNELDIEFKLWNSSLSKCFNLNLGLWD